MQILKTQETIIQEYSRCYGLGDDEEQACEACKQSDKMAGVWCNCTFIPSTYLDGEIDQRQLLCVLKLLWWDLAPRPLGPFASNVQPNSLTPPLNATGCWGIDRINSVNLRGLIPLDAR
ncbi:hypothetical protein BDQ12DRAFT_400471 [Crucibulum laeve]|uniref:Uncharacterized protein n=1 Tax=Crucibulum laeve TaxID=68775 RepID=A0A5C3LM22_9AGAR|nr:hypothetical protein BDQ12DRAFT_162278 [Crucibulum laeve]TFK33890.1 hypothetical protein BDQ12DRAFT_400471 [Crucibulum laeve]